MHPIVNQSEQRVRAGIRIVVYIVIAFPIVMIGNGIPLNGYQFLLTTMLSLGFFWIMFRFTDSRTRFDIAGINPEKIWWLECLKGTLIAAFVMGLIFLFQLMTGTIEFIGFSWNQPGISNWWYPVFLFLVQMACVGFYEELINRSYLIPNFKEGLTFGLIDAKKGTVIAIILSSVIFGFAHGLNPNVTALAMINIIFAGFMLAIPYVITGRLAYSVGIHFAWNFFQGGVFGFRVSGLPIRGTLINIQQSGDALWTGTLFGPEGGLIGTVGILLVLFFCLLFIKLSGITLSIHQNFTQTFLESESKLERIE